jgi:hypothetical protein
VSAARASGLVLAVALGLIACSVGQGTGSARGSVVSPECRLNNASYDMRPDFFAADFVTDPATPMGLTRQILDIRMQHGSYGEWSSDGLAVLVRDVDSIEHTLGTPIPIGPGMQVEMTLYLGATCPSGVPNSAFFTVPAIFSATSGTITFASVYAPDVDPNAFTIDAHFDGVHFEQDASHADLNGSFHFFYQRGQPAQHFP